MSLVPRTDNAVGRPIPRRHQEQVQSFSIAVQSPSKHAMSYILNNTNPQELVDRLRASMDSAMMLPEDFDNLLRSLQRFGILTSAAMEAAQDESLRHCVRCHKPYLERHNSFKACRLSHDEPRPMKSSRTDGPFQHFIPCCNKVVNMMERVDMYHFTGRHTTVSKNVKYNATNVLPCQQRKCAGQASGLGAGARATPGTAELTQA